MSKPSPRISRNRNPLSFNNIKIKNLKNYQLKLTSVKVKTKAYNVIIKLRQITLT